MAHPVRQGKPGYALLTVEPRESVRTVRVLFLIVLLLLFVPSRLMALAHGADLARFAGATLSTLLVCWFLYRLCMRATHQAWFIAISIPALYVATFSAPVYAWATLFVLYVVHRLSVRYLQGPPPADLPLATPPPPTDALETTVARSSAAGLSASPIQVIDLDDICEPYRRILFSQRILRAATASLAGSALFAAPTSLFVAIYDFGAPVFGVMAGILLTVLLALSGALYFSWMRALWRGSVRAGKIGLLVTVLAAAIGVARSVTRLNRELFVTGEIWFHVAARALQLSVLGLMGMGSALVVRRRRDVMLMGMLRQNARHNWRDAVLQLTGVVLPGGRSFRALAHKSFVLSALAFCIEGTAFYVYFRAGNNVLRVAEVPSPFPGSLTPLEGHYFSFVTIACLLLPVIYVSTQVTLTAAERIRHVARRASLRPAEDLLKEDGRPPVLFLRDFKDDQVSLDRAAMPAWARVVDPGLEQANLEDVLQACLSVGPVVAIGRPEDVKPPIGVARRYVQGEGWKDVVLSMMEAAVVVVVGASESAGVA